jgi:predicted MPP superfamily phosphohydrolase
MSEFKVTRYHIHTGDARRSPRNPFSLVLLSDLHNRSYGKDNGDLLQEIRAEHPEAILIAGDMVTAGKFPETEAAVSLMSELTRSFPVYYANGNHETRLKLQTYLYGDCYEKYTNMIRSFGVHLLENTHERTEFQKMPVTIWGLELQRQYFRRGRVSQLTSADIDAMLGTPDDASYHILLAHHPMYSDAYAHWGADLTLSGHLHGGIVRLPLIGGVISPQLRLFPRYDRGQYTINDRQLIVSAGLGSHTIPLRVNNPPEMIVIEFT